MAEISMLWDGTANPAIPRDGGPYDSSEVMDTMFRAILGGTGNYGVLYNWLGDLQVSGSTSPLNVADGGAVVYGMFYENDAPVSVSIPTPSSGYARYDYIVLQRNWATQTVRITRLSGVAGPAPSAPALTQVVDSVWEIPLALIYITDAGTITVTDARQYIAFSANWTEAITTVTEDMIYEGTGIDATLIPNRIRYQLKGAGQIEPDAITPCTWTAGGSWSYWGFAAGNAGWVYFLVPSNYVPGRLGFYIHNAPITLSANSTKWNYSLWYGTSGGALNPISSSRSFSQNGRSSTRLYRDLLCMLTANTIPQGAIVAIKLTRSDSDTYPDTMQLFGVEMEWIADA